MNIIAESLRIATAPTWEPCSVDECKSFAKVDLGDDDALVDRLRKSARERAGVETGRTIAATTYTWKLDRFPLGRAELTVPNPPLASVTSITYVDTAGDTQTLSSSLYQVDAHAEPGRILPAYGECWPDARCETPGAVTITFVAGYASAAAVPDMVKLGILELVSHWYADRDGAMDVPIGAQRLFQACWAGVYMYPDLRS